MRLEEFLRNEVIQKRGKTFDKLGDSGPFEFDGWRNDNCGVPCLYYRLASPETAPLKRVPLPEIRAALRYLVGTGELNKKAFTDLCPVAASEGDGGFTALGRALQKGGLVEYKEHEERFVLADEGKAE